MPHKWYQGKTGVVWNVTKRALGVEINKTVGGRIIKKRIHVRIEHVQPSQCRAEFLRRRADNDQKRAEAKKSGGAWPFKAGRCFALPKCCWRPTSCQAGGACASRAMLLGCPLACDTPGVVNASECIHPECQRTMHRPSLPSHLSLCAACTNPCPAAPYPPAVKMGPQKRLPAGPKGSVMLKGVKMETVAAIPYDIIKEGLV